MPSRFSCFDKLAKRLRKGTIVPRQGHLCAKVRALLCLREAQEMHKSDTTRKSETQISIFQRYESQTSHLYFGNKLLRFFRINIQGTSLTCHLFLSTRKCPSSPATEVFTNNFISPINTQNKGKK